LHSRFTHSEKSRAGEQVLRGAAKEIDIRRAAGDYILAPAL
jgi:hypothetical protein